MKWFDKLGVTMSALCAAHCALVPLLIFFGLFSVSADTLDDKGQHTFLVIATMIFGILTALVGTWRHKDTAAWKYIFAAVIVSIMQVMFHDFFESDKWLHAVPDFVIGLAIIASHYENHKAWSKHHCSKCPGGDH